MMSLTASQISYSSQAESSCPGCGDVMESFYTFKNVPSNSCILMDSEEEARQYPRGDIILGFCNSCGFIGNIAFIPELTEYSGKYEETQGYSPTFQKFHDNLAKDLIDRYKLHDKTVLEIGCGKGEFLAMLCKLGPNSGLGFDPGYDKNRNIILTLAELTGKYPPGTTWEDNFIAKGCWIINGYFEINTHLYEIKGLQYEVPYSVGKQELVIEGGGAPKIYIKSQTGVINKLITDKDLKKVKFVDNKVIKE